MRRFAILVVGFEDDHWKQVRDLLPANVEVCTVDSQGGASCLSRRMIFINGQPFGNAVGATDSTSRFCWAFDFFIQY